MIHPLPSWASLLDLFAAILYLAYFVRANTTVARAAFAALGLGFGLHALVIGQAFFSHGYTHAHGPAEAVSLLGWFLAGGLLAVQKAYRLPAIGAFSTPLVVAVVVPAALMHTERHPLPASLQLAGLPVHVVVAFAGIAAFAPAAGASVAYLLLEHQMKRKRFGVVFARLPSLQVLDEVSNRLTRWAWSRFRSRS